MIDMNAETPHGFPAIKQRHPIHPSIPTLYRWALKGLRGVRLETIKVGGRRYTTFEAVDRFASRLTEPRPISEPMDPEYRQREMAQAAEKAEDLLGIRPRSRTGPRRVS